MTLWFTNLHDFLAMNGYGLYVWPAWLMVLGLLLVQYLYAHHERRQVLQDIRRFERRRQAQQGDATQHGNSTEGPNESQT